MSWPEYRRLQAESEKAWSDAEELSDVAGVPYDDHNGNKRDVGEPRGLIKMVLKPWCASHMVEFT